MRSATLPAPKASSQLRWCRVEATVQFPETFKCELGSSLHGLKVRYTTYGNLSRARDNVVWVLHPLTCCSDPIRWWPEMVGPGKALDPTKDYIICANTIGSCYGSTGPNSASLATGNNYGAEFPVITMKDVVRAHELLRKRLGIKRIQLGIGASYGGQQLIEWMAMAPRLFDRACIIGATDRQSPWAIALNESQRLAMAADQTTFTNSPTAGHAGMAAARSFAVLSYRTPKAYALRQAEVDSSVANNFRASEYQKHIGAQFAKRFDAKSYWTLTKVMDSHNVSRGREAGGDVLSTIDSKTLFLGLEGDILFPPESLEAVSSRLRNASYSMLRCDYGHDSILINAAEIERYVVRHRFASEATTLIDRD